MKQYRHRRSANPANPFPTLEPGELSVNTANRQLAAGDAASGTVGAPLPLIAVRYFDARGKYAVGDYVVNAGTMYKCTVAHGPAAFNPSNFTAVGSGGGGGATLITSDTPPPAPVDNSLWWDSENGLLYLRYNDGNSSQWVLASPIGGGGGGSVDTSMFVLKAGDTMTGSLWMDLPGSADLPFNALFPNGSSWIYQDGGGYAEQGVEGCGDVVEHGGYSFYAQRGSRAAQTPLLVGDNIGTFYYLSKDTAGTEGLRAAIRTIVDAAPTIGNVPTSFVFTSGGADGGVERLRISSTGVSYFSGNVQAPLLNIQAATGNATLLLNAVTDAQASINFYNATNLKWQLGNQLGTSSFFLYSVPANKVAFEIVNATCTAQFGGTIKAPVLHLGPVIDANFPPQYKLAITDGTSYAHYSGPDTLGMDSYNNSNQPPYVNLNRARGTMDASLPVQTSDRIGAFVWGAQYGPNPVTDWGNAAQLDVTIDTTVTGSNLPACFNFISNGNSNLFIASDGHLTVRADPVNPMHLATKQYVDAGVRAINNVTATAYTLVLTDTGKLLSVFNGPSNAVSITVPLNAVVAFAIGAQIDIASSIANVVTIVPASGVIMNSEDSKRKLPKQGSCATLVKVSTDVWVLSGSLMA